jgi:hypothetical protein
MLSSKVDMLNATFITWIMLSVHWAAIGKLIALQIGAMYPDLASPFLPSTLVLHLP